MKYLLLNPKKRPKKINKKIMNELIEYIKDETKKQHFPSRREIDRTFNIRLDSYFKNIRDLYTKAGRKYKLHANQNIKYIKAKLLLELITKNIIKFDLKFISARCIREKGIDILAEREGKKVGIEIKAYNKNEKIKTKDINQVKRFIKKENLNEAMIITTADKKKKNLDIPKNILLINYHKLSKILNIKEDKTISFIRNYSINREDISRKIKRQKILDYVYNKYKSEERKPGYSEILKELHLDLYSYFKNLSEIYKILNVPPPLKNMKGKGAKKPDQECIELWKNEFKKYILKNIKEKRKYTSGEELKTHFKISHIWNITNMSKLYKELNLKPYLKRKKRTTFAQEFGCDYQ